MIRSKNECTNFWYSIFPKCPILFILLCQQRLHTKSSKEVWLCPTKTCLTNKITLDYFEAHRESVGYLHQQYMNPMKSHSKKYLKLEQKKIMSIPPGWNLMYGDKLYTRPFRTVHIESPFWCCLTSLMEISLLFDCPFKPDTR